MRAKRQRKKNNHKIIKLVSLFIVIVVAAYCLVAAFKPLPKIEAIGQPSTLSDESDLSVTWPAAQESSVGVLGYGTVASYGAQEKAPTASIAKIVVALAVLKERPLQLTQQGPILTMTAQNVADYNAFLAEDGSVVKVAVGEQISEYQALQAMLLPSANNMADALAQWAFGSTANYVSYANKLVASLGMKNTTISDPSGFSPNTVSTSNDLIILGEQAMESPVIAQIVSEASTTIPVAGTIYNVNPYLGKDNIVGIKTGNTDQAGGCYLVAATFPYPDGQSITIVASILKAPTLKAALSDGIVLINSVKSKISVKSVSSGYVAAVYKAPWGQEVDATTKNTVSAPTLPGLPLLFSTSAESISPLIQTGASVGASSLSAGNTNSETVLSLDQSLNSPSIYWRLTHPKYIFDISY